ncbi:hypothetical protein Tco_1089560, partial [Tanacetum coccineum]
VTALTEIVKELVLMNKATQQATVKAIEEICVTCGGPHPYYECLAIDGNTFNASAATGTYNQGGPGYRPQGDLNYRASNQMGPPGFNQQRGQNFSQGNNNYQASNYQTPNNQAQVGPSNEFSNYMMTNDVNMRVMQNQINNMKVELSKQTNELKNMMSSFMQMNSPSGSGSLPSNTVSNPRGDLKAVTTRSRVSYDGPTVPLTFSPLPKDVEHETEATKDKVQTTNLGSIAYV